MGSLSIILSVTVYCSWGWSWRKCSGGVEMAVCEWAWMQEHSVFCGGIFKHVPRWNIMCHCSGWLLWQRMISHWNEWATFSVVIISWLFCATWWTLHTEHSWYIWAGWCGMWQVRTGERWGEECCQGQLQWWNRATRNCYFTWKSGYRDEVMKYKCVIQPSKPHLYVQYHEEVKMHIQNWRL